MDLFRPTILEVALVRNSPSILDEIPPAVVHHDLSPDSLGGVRNISGVFKRVGSDMARNKYIYMFDKPVPASETNNKHGFDKLVKTEVPLQVLPETFAKFKTPEKFFANTVQQDILIESIRQSIEPIKVQYPSGASVDEIATAFVSHISQSDAKICFHLGVEPLEVTRNPHFLSWVRRNYGGSDLIINGNVSLGTCKVSFHQTSKPDFYVLHKSKDFAAISVDGAAHSLEESAHSLEEGAHSIDESAHSLEESAVQDDDVHLVGLAGECKQTGTNESQTLANMVAVAGYVTHEALKKNLKPRRVTIYGVGCIYQANRAFLRKLCFNFEERSTDFYNLGKKEEIGKQFALAVQLLRTHKDN